MKTIRLFFLIMMFMCTALPLLSEETRIFSYTYYLAAGNEQAASDAIQKLARERGGYLKNLSGQEITIRLAPGYNEELKSLLVKHGYILDEQITREDAGEKLADLSTRLQVKEKLLKELYALFNASQFHQTLDVEKEIGKLIVEIERIKGEMTFYRDRITLSEFTIHMNRIPSAANRSMVFKWQWINDLGIPGLIEEANDEN